MLNLYRELFRSFQQHELRYAVIGGVAAVLHGVPRATFDLDILIEASEENVSRLLAALLEAGFATASLTTVEDVLANEITVFQDRLRLDVFTRVPGISFDEVWPRCELISFQGQGLLLLARQDLIAAKRASNRAIDLEDVRLLELPAESS